MSVALQKGWKANLKYDLPAGLVVFLVALPLCLGIALAINQNRSLGLFFNDRH
jgi:MFS superfamily sulfate permease-like transporter